MIGGLLLAWAFLMGRKQGGALKILGRATSSAPQNEAESKQALADLRREVVNHLRRKYMTIQVASWMVAGAFFMRFISAVLS